MRAADDFAVIGDIYKKLTAVPEHKRTGSSASHCAHCPKEPDERCDSSCAAEGVKAGVVAFSGSTERKWWCARCMSHRIAGCTDSGCPTPYGGCA